MEGVTAIQSEIQPFIFYFLQNLKSDKQINEIKNLSDKIIKSQLMKSDQTSYFSLTQKNEIREIVREELSKIIADNMMQKRELKNAKKTIT